MVQKFKDLYSAEVIPYLKETFDIRIYIKFLNRKNSNQSWIRSSSTKQKGIR